MSTRTAPHVSRMLMNLPLLMTVLNAPSALAADEDLVRVVAIAEHGSITPGGTVWVGIRMDMEEGWYTYWPGKNDSGEGSSIKPSGPEGVTFGSVQWPAPTRYLLPGDILDHVYRKSVTALIPVTAPQEARIGSSIDMTFDVSWLVCSTVCIPGDKTVTLSLPVTEQSAVADSDSVKIIADARARIPEPLPQDKRLVTMQWEGSQVTIRARGSFRLAFYPDTKSSIISNIHHGGSAETDFLTLNIVGEPVLLSGILEVFSSDGRSRVFQVRSSPTAPNG